MYTESHLGIEALKKMKVGKDKLIDTIKVTMGVRGKSLRLDTNEYGRPLATNDGAIIARHFKLEDRIENNGVESLQESAEKTNDEAGDGTSTTMFIQNEIEDRGLKAITVGADGIALSEGIRKATDKIIKHIETERVEATTLEALTAVATISSREPEVAKIIAEVVKKAGVDGIITIEDRREADTVYERIEGLKLRGGFFSEFFVNLPERRQTVFNNVPIFVTDRTLTLASEMSKIFEVVTNLGFKNAIVVANGIDGDALATLVANWHEKRIFILPLRVQTYGEAGAGAVRDVASITGATYFDENEPRTLLEIVPKDFGRAYKTVTDRNETVIISDNEDLKQERIKELEGALESAKEFEAESIRERIAKLKSAMFTIKVGGRSDSERNDRKTKVDDAIKSAKAALRGGTVAGGGSALYRAAMAQDKPDITTDEGIGERIVYQSAIAPLLQLAKNSGYTIDRTDLEAILDKNTTINFKTCKVANAYDEGVLDALLVVTSSIQNAATGASDFLSLGGVVIGKQIKQEERV